MNKRTRIVSYISIFAVVFMLGWSVGFIVSTARNDQIVQSSADLFTETLAKQAEQQKVDFGVFWKVREMLKENYISEDNLTDQKLLYGSIKGLAEAVEDPYTVFMTPSETAEFNGSLNGELEGIGAELTVKNQLLTVSSVLNESPAQKAGLQAKDSILKIDGKMVADLTLLEAVNQIRGKKGTEVVLTIMREGVENPFDLKITRDKVLVESVTSQEVEKGIWLLTINQFGDDTKVEYDQAITKIKLADPQGLIIDLRYNGGGYLVGAVEIMSAIVAGEKEIVSIKYRDPDRNETYRTDGKVQLADVPLVVLINQSSASASEIVAAAVQDLKRGILIGETSYGKGTVQEVDPLNDGSSLRMTVAKWYSPLGKEFDEVGIKPDQEVKMTEEDYDNDRDPQLDTAVKYLQSVIK
jgi:carboxyl-terminal processing protease